MSNDSTVTNGIPDDIEESAKRIYAEFLEKNSEGIKWCNPSTRTYHVIRGWTLRGPIPPGIQITSEGLANDRRKGKVKQRKGHRP